MGSFDHRTAVSCCCLKVEEKMEIARAAIPTFPQLGGCWEMSFPQGLLVEMNDGKTGQSGPS